tara:strand:- start:11736 stop:13034 length:1299 start_codon:yes stop_codon:yes gene_type:complete
MVTIVKMFYNLLNFINNIKKNPYFVITVLPYALGTIADQLKTAQLITNKKLIIITPNIFQKLLNYHISNTSIINDIIINHSNQNKYLLIKNFLTFILNIEFLIRRSTSLLLKNLFKIKLSEQNFFPEVGDYKQIYPPFIKKFNKKKNTDFLPKYDFNKINVDFEEDKKIYCNKILNKYGLDINKEKIVCIHVRDPYYRSDFSRRLIRNSDINIYKKSIEFLIEKGFFVIRIGRISDQKLYKKKVVGYLDYSFMEEREDIIDLYLIKKCHFYLSGSTSGPLDYAMYMHNKKCLILNNPRIFEAFPTNKYSRSTLKKIFWKNNGNQINIEEYLNLPNRYHDPFFSCDDEIYYKDHSSEENLNETKNYLDLLKSNNYYQSDIQKKINYKIKKKLLDKYFNEKDNNIKNIWFHELTNINNSSGCLSENYINTNLSN